MSFAHTFSITLHVLLLYPHVVPNLDPKLVWMVHSPEIPSFIPNVISHHVPYHPDTLLPFSR